MKSETDNHPWLNFLKARKAAMLWMRDEMKKTDEEIAADLSMDAEQVRAILIYQDQKGYELEKHLERVLNDLPADDFERMRTYLIQKISEEAENWMLMNEKAQKNKSESLEPTSEKLDAAKKESEAERDKEAMIFRSNANKSPPTKSNECENAQQKIEASYIHYEAMLKERVEDFEYLLTEHYEKLVEKMKRKAEKATPPGAAS